MACHICICLSRIPSVRATGWETKVIWQFSNCNAHINNALWVISIIFPIGHKLDSTMDNRIGQFSKTAVMSFGREKKKRKKVIFNVANIFSEVFLHQFSPISKKKKNCRIIYHVLKTWWRPTAPKTFWLMKTWPT